MPKKRISFRLDEDDIRSLEYVADRMGAGNLSEAERVIIRLVRALVDEDVAVKDIFNEDILKLTGIDQKPLKDIRMLTALKRPEKLAELYKNE